MLTTVLLAAISLGWPVDVEAGTARRLVWAPFGLFAVLGWASAVFMSTHPLLVAAMFGQS